jgi:hypothetical protein
MKKEVVYTEDYALILSDDKMVDNDYYAYYIDEQFCINNDHYLFPKGAKKIIAHLPLSDAPILEGVPLLPSFSWGQQDDVKELSEREYREFPHNPKDKTDWHYNRDVHCFKKRKAFIKGYNKAKEKYKYTEFDIIQAFEYGWNQRHFGQMSEDKLQQIQQTFIQSLQQLSRPTHFEFENVYRVKSGTIQEHKEGKAGYEYYELKTTTNSQGQVELVGKYLNQ